MRQLILSATILLAANASLTQEISGSAEASGPELRRYSVELIVFAYAEDVATGSEQFLPEVVEVEPSAGVELDSERWPLEGPLADDSKPTDTEIPAEPGAADAVLVNEFGDRVNEKGQLVDENGQLIGGYNPYAVVMFGAAELCLLDTGDRLDRIDAYEPLLHVGWAQPALGEEDARTITMEDLGAAVDGLEGEFKLYLSRYLHLIVDLDLAARRGNGVDVDGVDGNVGGDLSYEDTVALYGRREGLRAATPPGLRESSNDETEGLPSAPMLKVLPLRYSIDENRIVNSGEQRYFDHPKFGVVAKVERVELPDLPEVTDDTDVLLPVGGQ